jgi:catechol 2,3-dioxygenase-like lactoylglutathione lyase family enzyme
MTAPAMDGLGHIDLTVTDAERSVDWWTEVMGFDVLVAAWERPGFQGWTMAHPSGLAVTLIVHDRGDRTAFDETRVGLDHLAFRVRDYQTLEAWVEHLDALGVPHSGIQDEHGPAGPLIVLRDPDNIQLELTAGWHLTT